MVIFYSLHLYKSLHILWVFVALTQHKWAKLSCSTVAFDQLNQLTSEASRMSANKTAAPDVPRMKPQRSSAHPWSLPRS